MGLQFGEILHAVASSAAPAHASLLSGLVMMSALVFWVDFQPVQASDQIIDD
jgi:hypothetical protein